MMQFDLFKIQAGWAYVRLVTGANEVIITGSHTPHDILRDFVDIVAALRTTPNADCCWNQEPGELHWQFLRTGDNLKIAISEFTRVKVPGRHGPNGKTIFEAEGEWLKFARQVFKSLRLIGKSMGVAGYEQQWRHRFPREAYEKLESAIHQPSVPGSKG